MADRGATSVLWCIVGYMTQHVPLALADPADRAVRERRALARHRADRVERAGEIPCTTCGGTAAAAVVDVEGNEWLRCGCEENAARLRTRTTNLAHSLRAVDPADRSNRIAP